MLSRPFQGGAIFVLIAGIEVQKKRRSTRPGWLPQFPVWQADKTAFVSPRDLEQG